MTKRDPDLPSVPTVQVIERMFMLIDALASREDVITLKEISEKTGLHPSTAERLYISLLSESFFWLPTTRNAFEPMQPAPG